MEKRNLVNISLRWGEFYAHEHFVFSSGSKAVLKARKAWCLGRLQGLMALIDPQCPQNPGERLLHTY
jgi:hypothetical protein